MRLWTTLAGLAREITRKETTGYGEVRDNGPKEYALERLVWTGKTPFELFDMKARPDGFELTFTEPVDPKTAGDVKSYKMETYCYIYQAAYGSPEVDHTRPTIKSATVAADGKSVKLVVDGLQIGDATIKYFDLIHPWQRLAVIGIGIVGYIAV